MRFVIVGAGRVGLRTARALADSNHEVTLVDSAPEALERAQAAGFEVVEGDGAREPVLVAADVENVDAVAALTADLNANFAACLIAKEYGCRTVMRIDEDYREAVYREYADQIDEVVYPERLGAIAAKNALVGGSVRAIADIERDLQLVEFTITEASPMHAYNLSELELPGRARLLAFGQDDEPLRIPTPDDTLEAGSRLVILTAFDKLGDVRRIVAGDTEVALGGA